MPIKVSLPPEEQIERDAAALLAEYAQARGVVRSAPPIPIEDIVEKHLKLGIEFDDMHQLFGVPRLGSRSRHPRRDFLRRAPDRHRRKPRPGGEPVEGRPLSLHARARGRRTLAAAPSSVRQGPGAGLLVQ